MTKEEIQKELKRLQKELDKLDTKFESGWYKDDALPKWLIYIDYENLKCYGFDEEGDWHECDNFEDKEDLGAESDPTERPATPQEVETALIEEAKRRGFKEGVRFCSTFNGYEVKGNDIEPKWLEGKGELRGHGGGIFQNGQWAEIIEDKVVINGKEIVVEDGIIYIGCTSLGSKSSALGTLDHLDNCGINYLQHKECADMFSVKELIRTIKDIK